MNTSSLEELHTAIVDTCEGYETALADAETLELKQLFSGLLAMHKKHHTELHGMLKAEAITPNEEPSLMAAVHDSVINVRSVITGLKPALSSFADGEEMLLKKYDATIEESPVHLEVLTRQSSEISIKIDELRNAAKF